MLRNYLKIAWRNLIRNKTFSAINIVGLALGMASSLLIMLWVQDERSIGRQYANAEHLYRVMENEIADGRVVTDEDTPGILADELKRVMPEVQYAAGFSGLEEHVLQVGTKVARQQGHFVGADWFRMYNISLLAGNPQTALVSPNSMAISRQLAELYFVSAEQAIGKAIRLDSWTDYKITAVFDNLPANTPDPYDFLLDWTSHLKREPWLNVWENSGPGTRLQLRPDADLANVAAKFKAFLKGRNADIGPHFTIELFLQPETEAYLYSNFKDGQRDGGRIEYVRLFTIVAVFLLLIASINFMNLATARSIKRAREVGVRKAVGAERFSLIGQFMGEALLLTTCALVLGVLLVNLTLPLFNQLTAKTLALPLAHPNTWGLLLALLGVMSILAGSYPALFLSSLKPVQVLKGRGLQIGSSARLFRQGLVVFQFALSMLMIVGTLVVYRQLQYIQNRNLGFDRENLIRLQREGNLVGQYDLFKERLQQMPGVQSITFLKSNPLKNGNTSDGVTWRGKDPTTAIQFNNTTVGYDYVKTLNLTLLRGRDFSPAFGTDSTNFLINEAAAKRMGFKDPVGQPLTMWGRPGIIVGLLKDFHFNSLHVPVRPIIIRMVGKWDGGNILIRTKAGQTGQALSSIETLCRELNPKFPFSYAFVDADFAKQYQSETVVGRLAQLFAALAILIACLGLFGLAAFTAEQRTKEIGVRKVLGASVTSIVALLSKDFLTLVLIAIVIASPIAWYAMNKWLQGFAYKIDIEWWYFALAGLLAVGIALLTVSFQSVKAALMNPVKSLRSE